MIVAEPMTMLTDYAVAGVAVWLGSLLYMARKAHTARRLWSFAFFVLALAAAAGGTHHGFSPLMGDTLANLLWKLVVLAVGISSFGMMAGSAYATTRGASRAVLLTVAGMQLAAYSGWMLIHDAYRYVVFDTAAAMVLLSTLHAHGALVRRDHASYWILGGVAVSVLAAVIQFFHVGLHEHFNHNDLHHVIQIFAMTLLYRGGKLMRDRTEMDQS